MHLYYTTLYIYFNVFKKIFAGIGLLLYNKYIISCDNYFLYLKGFVYGFII